MLPQAIKSFPAILGCVLAFTIPAGAVQILQLRVVEGEGVSYRVGTRATRGITVMVSDEAGRPVDMASVSFRLPDEGASGTFNSGMRTEIVATGPDGRASIWGMHWNKTPGTFEIRISAVKDQARAGLVSTQYLSESAAPTAGGEGVFTSSSHSGHKWLWIAAVATGAAAGGAFALLHSSSNTATTPNPAVVGISIGTPTVIVGHP